MGKSDEGWIHHRPSGEDSDLNRYITSYIFHLSSKIYALAIVYRIHTD